jgi:hypothetical protein
MKKYAYYVSSEPKGSVGYGWNFCGETRPCVENGKFITGYARIQLADAIMLCCGVWTLTTQVEDVPRSDCQFSDNWESFIP